MERKFRVGDYVVMLNDNQNGYFFGTPMMDRTFRVRAIGKHENEPSIVIDDERPLGLFNRRFRHATEVEAVAARLQGVE